MVERFVVVEDAGPLIDPMIVEGQIHGGVARGIANAFYEQVIYDDRGKVLTGSLADYPVPTTPEFPSIELHHLETLTEASVPGVGDERLCFSYCAPGSGKLSIDTKLLPADPDKSSSLCLNTSDVGLGSRAVKLPVSIYFPNWAI
jgi:hypothetical protein